MPYWLRIRDIFTPQIPNSQAGKAPTYISDMRARCHFHHISLLRPPEAWRLLISLHLYFASRLDVASLDSSPPPRRIMALLYIIVEGFFCHFISFVNASRFCYMKRATQSKFPLFHLLAAGDHDGQR